MNRRNTAASHSTGGSSSSISLPPKKKFLQSNRFAAMYVANTSYPFFDAFTSSKPSQSAFHKEQISTSSYENLDRYVKAMYQSNLMDYRESQKVYQRPLPLLLQELLKLQSRNGKFESLQTLYRLLQMPIIISWNREETAEEWEKATALGLLVMRQHIEYFEDIIEQHDLANQWISRDTLLIEGRDVYTKNVGQGGSLNVVYPSMSQIDTIKSSSFVIGGMDPQQLQQLQQQQQLQQSRSQSTPQLAQNSSHFNDEGSQSSYQGGMSILTDQTIASSGKQKRKEEKQQKQEQQANSITNEEELDSQTINETTEVANPPWR